MAVVVFDRSRRGGMLTCQHRLLSAMLARRHTARDRTAASRDVSLPASTDRTDELQPSTSAARPATEHAASVRPDGSDRSNWIRA